MSEEQVSQNNTEDASAQIEFNATKDATGGGETTTEPFYKEDKKVEASDDQTETKKADEPEAEGKTEEKESGDAEDFSLDNPKDSGLTDADMERIVSYAKEQGLGKDAAEKLVKFQSEAKDNFMVSMQEEHSQRAMQWQQDVRADKELGGQNFEQSVEYAKNAAKKFGSEEFINMLDESGFGNHPEVVRVFSRIGRAMDNDTLEKGGVHSGGQRSMEDVFYSKNE